MFPVYFFVEYRSTNFFAGVDTSGLSRCCSILELCSGVASYIRVTSTGSASAVQDLYATSYELHRNFIYAPFCPQITLSFKIGIKNLNKSEMQNLSCSRLLVSLLFPSAYQMIACVLNTSLGSDSVVRYCRRSTL